MIGVIVDEVIPFPRTKWWVYESLSTDGEFLEFSKIVDQGDFPIQSFRRHPMETDRDVERRIMAEEEAYKVRRSLYILRNIGMMLHDVIPFAEPFMALGTDLDIRIKQVKAHIEHSTMDFFNCLVGRRFLFKGGITFDNLSTLVPHITFKLEWQLTPLDRRTEQIWISSLPCLP